MMMSKANVKVTKNMKNTVWAITFEPDVVEYRPIHHIDKGQYQGPWHIWGHIQLKKNYFHLDRSKSQGHKDGALCLKVPSISQKSVKKCKNKKIV